MIDAIPRGKHTTKRRCIMPLQLSNHARARLQQRAIPLPVLDYLLNFGKKVHDHHGAEILFFDHRARTQIRRAMSEQDFKHIEAKLDTYAVIGSNGVVLTVGHRTKKINRH
jgi:hypothetical protein